MGLCQGSVGGATFLALKDSKATDTRTQLVYVLARFQGKHVSRCVINAALCNGAHLIVWHARAVDAQARVEPVCPTIGAGVSARPAW